MPLTNQYPDDENITWRLSFYAQSTIRTVVPVKG